MSHGVWCLIAVLILLLFPVPDVGCKLGTQPSKAQSLCIRFWTKAGCRFVLLFHLWYFAVFYCYCCLFFEDFSYTWTPHISENFSFLINLLITLLAFMVKNLPTTTQGKSILTPSLRWSRSILVGTSWQQEYMTRAPHIFLDQAAVSLV